MPKRERKRLSRGGAGEAAAMGREDLRGGGSTFCIQAGCIVVVGCVCKVHDVCYFFFFSSETMFFVFIFFCLTSERLAGACASRCASVEPSRCVSKSMTRFSSRGTACGRAKNSWGGAAEGRDASKHFFSFFFFFRYLDIFFDKA